MKIFDKFAVIQKAKNVHRSTWLTYLCSDSSCIKAWSASTAKENDINKRNSCLHRQHNQNIPMLAQKIQLTTGEEGGEREREREGEQ